MPKKSAAMFAFFTPFRRRFRGSLIRAEIQIVVTSLLLVSLDFLRGSLVSAAIGRDFTRFLSLLCVTVLVVLLKCWTFYLYTFHFRKYKILSLAELRQEILFALLGRGFPEYLKRPSGEYFSIYQSQVDRLGGNYYDSWYGSQQIIFEVLFALLSLLWISPWLCLAALVLLLPGILVPELFARRTKALSTLTVNTHNQLIARFKDRLQAFELIDNYGVQEEFDSAMQKDSEACRRTASKTGVFQWFVVTSGQFLTAFAMVAFVLLAAWLLSRGRLSLAYFISATGLMTSLQGNSFYIASYVHIFVTAQSPLEAVRGLLDQADPERLQNLKLLAASSEELPERAEEIPDKLSVRFDQVSFAYPEQPERLLFAELSFHADSPGLVLIRGVSGSGKSTAMNLLLAYYPVLSGQISINGQPLQDGQETGRLITVLRQEAAFLSDDLLSNLTLYQDYDSARLYDLLNRLGLSKLASPEALTQPVDRTAATLSGGEARRLMLVRSLLHPRPILILDEPLANLDAESMQLVVRLILEESRKRLIFLISHQVPEELRQAASQEIRIGD